ncbi:MAG: hypothetical protein HKL90_01765 [Elusimicrobia bacterium]|nr:hypothetical protein [Elusimicrobiota bacterium]
MSVSAHLSPEPERRLWAILDGVRRTVERTEAKLGALTVLAFAELALIALAVPDGALSTAAVSLLGACLLIGALAAAPLSRLPPPLSFLEPRKDKTSVNDCLIAAEDLSKYTQNELTARLDKYLGGGLTATPYHEDIVGQIVRGATVAARQRRLLGATCLLVAGGQLCLLGRLLWRR